MPLCDSSNSDDLDQFWYADAY
ncbi:hypothetical protein SBBP2_570031 [Burkholderiales bacterium]|nr:hypothetical protein SBBP2_570031 [Burkholderiales bacterium]